MNEDQPNDATPDVVEPTGEPAVESSRSGSPGEPTGRPSYTRGALFTLLGGGALFLQLASSQQLPRGALVGLVSTSMLVVGLLELLGYLRRSDWDVPLLSTSFGRKPDEPWFMAPVVTVPAAVVIALVTAFATHGSDLGLGVALLFGTLVVGLSAIRRPTLIPLVLLTAIGLPRLGAFALWDPWETHYGEVAREILARDDWISLWWAQDGWFWSKPILIFWTEAWSMSALGVSAMPDAHPAHAEWALRLPTFAMSLAAIYSVQALASRAFGRRAGMLAAIIVGTMPQFYLLAHQAITDMPLCAALTVAVCLLGFAVIEDSESRPSRIRIGPYGVSSHTAVAGLVLACALPQIVYLATRDITFYPSRFAFGIGPDSFLEGSAGNAGVPGNAPVAVRPPVFVHPWPLAQALGFGGLLAFVMWLVRRATTRRGVAMIGFYIACAIGLLGKGIPGVALPGLVALLYLLASRRWSLLSRGELHVTVGSAIVLLIGMPWYVAMYVRHGRAFVDRILIHDHINRLASGVHGDNGAIDYFLGQLGYASFPFTGLIPLAVLGFAFVAMQRRPRGEAEGVDPARETAVLVALWAMAGFTLFNAMITKFHHYIFPVVPPAGLLVGVLVDRMLGDESEFGRFRRHAGILATVGTLVLLVAFAGAYGDPRGIVPASANGHDWVVAHGWPTWVVAVVALVGVSTIGAAIAMNVGPSRPLTSLERGLGAAALGAAVVTAFVGRDMSWVTATRPAGYERFVQLFIYLYSRPFPMQYDYRPVFSAVSIVATIGIGLLALRRGRDVGLRMLLASALALSAFSVNVYLPDLAEHWSTNRLVDRYYAQRHDEEPLIAFQMNWKGENFYTGNRVYAFADVETSAVRAYLESKRGRHVFAVLEHTRVDSFRALLPAGSKLELRSTMRENNKFVLVYARLGATPHS